MDSGSTAGSSLDFNHLLRNPIPIQVVCPASLSPTIRFRYFHRRTGGGSSCPTTSDSRSCTGSLSGTFSGIRYPIVRRPLPLLVSLLLVLYASQTSPLEILKRFCSLIGLPPIAGWHIEIPAPNTTPWLPSCFQDFIHCYYGLFRPWSPLPYSRPRVLHLRAVSDSHRKSPRFHVPLDRLSASSGHLHAGCHPVPETGFAGS